MKVRSNILKLCLFATGLSGIVAEYVLSTLASYLLGDSVRQWTLIVSIMLFAMGLGSRLSKFFDRRLLEKFMIIEFLLSIFTSFSSLMAYSSASFSLYPGILIYTLSIVIGLLIGMEIPLVIRINNDFENLKLNVSSVLENDYYGSLLGGVFFAFIGLPFLGLTYTPFILGLINLSVAGVLLVFLWKSLESNTRKWLMSSGIFVFLMIAVGINFAQTIIQIGEQRRYEDKVILSTQTRYQQITLTQSKSDDFLYINGNQQLSTIDDAHYHEPLVHPVMEMATNPESVLVLGGGDGCAVREIIKYKGVKEIILVDLDPKMTQLAKEHPVLTAINNFALDDSRVKIVNQDAYTYLEETKKYFDVIIADFPDPKSIELSRLYSQEFYLLCKKHLRPMGYLITQATSPYYAENVFLSINQTMQESGFNTVPLHNLVLTLGEWGWIVGSPTISSDKLKNQLQRIYFNVPTAWINNEAMTHLTSFGKNVDFSKKVKINKVHDPVLFRYYKNSQWNFY